jgi:hypothetical protein
MVLFVLSVLIRGTNNVKVDKVSIFLYNCRLNFEPALMAQLDVQLNVVEDKVSVWPVLQA